MVLIVLASLVILGIAFFQAVQGLFSALIMAILTVLAAAIAFNYYDMLAEALVGRLGAYAPGVSLLACFAVPLLALREIFDRVIRGNTDLGMWAGRIGGGALGLITGVIVTGVLLIVIQLLPLPGTILMYTPYDATLTAQDSGPAGWACNFTLGLMKTLSNGSLQPITSEASLAGAHDDLVLEAFCARSRPKGARAEALPDALSVEFTRVLPDPDSKAGKKVANRAELQGILDTTPGYRQSESQLAQEDTRVLAVRVKVDELARHEDDNWYRLPATQFRLVTDRGASFYPVGYLTRPGTWQVSTVRTEEGMAKVSEIVVARPWEREGGPKKLIVDWLYRLPVDAIPEHIIFRRSSSVALKPMIGMLPPKAAVGALSSKPVTRRATFTAVKRKWIIMPERAEVSASLPDGINLKVPASKDQTPAALKRLDHADGVIKGLDVDGELEQLADADGNYINRFFVPEGKWMMVQVTCKVEARHRVPGELLREFQPRLVLDDDSAAPHKGALLVYKVDQEDQIYWYYEASGDQMPLKPRFAELLSNNAAQAKRVVLQFVVPVAKARSIIALEFAGKDEVRSFPLSPSLACKKY